MIDRKAQCQRFDLGTRAAQVHYLVARDRGHTKALVGLSPYQTLRRETREDLTYDTDADPLTGAEIISPDRLARPELAPQQTGADLEI